MRRRFRASLSASTLLLVAAGVSTGCGGGGSADVVREILCGSGHARGVLTVGLDLSVLDGLSVPGGANAPKATSDEGLASLLNNALAKVVDPKNLNVASVTSAVPGDTIRFLRLGGTFGGGFGVATRALASAARSTPSLAGVFRFVREGYKVAKSDVWDDTHSDAFELEFSRFSQPSAWVGMSAAPAKGEPDAKQWALAQTDFAAASRLFPNASREVRVAVIDTGVDLEHPDLAGVLEPGYNALDGSARADDDNGHGTHCAGVIAAQAKGEGAPLGVAARANVRIIPVKVLSKDGSGSSDAIEKGIRWAVKTAKADVVSLSLGGGAEYADVRKNGGLSNEIIKEAIAAGVVVVVAAGNEGCPLGGKCEQKAFLSTRVFNEYTVVPCAYEGTICVGATEPDEKLAGYSNFSSGKSKASYRTRADVNAPGSRIYSTWPVSLSKGGDPYRAISGTSMATPYVAGVAALLKANAKDPKDVDQEFVRAYLSKGLVDEPTAKKKSGTGRVDLYGTAYAYSRDYLKSSLAGAVPPSGEPKAVDVPGLPAEEGGGAVGNVWDLLCAL